MLATAQHLHKLEGENLQQLEYLNVGACDRLNLDLNVESGKAMLTRFKLRLNLKISSNTLNLGYINFDHSQVFILHFIPLNISS